MSAGTVRAADLHPIVEIETGYFFGGSENGKWIKPDQAAKSVANKTNYQVCGLTKQAGQITAGKPKSVDEPCPDTLMVSLSSKPKDGVIGLAATWNALPRKPVIADATQSVFLSETRGRPPWSVEELWVIDEANLKSVGSMMAASVGGNSRARRSDRGNFIVDQRAAAIIRP